MTSETSISLTRQERVRAGAELARQLRVYGIRVSKWRTSSSGGAFPASRRIEIPAPTNTDRFGVCMHEIKHIIDCGRRSRFEEEFRCDMYALEWIDKLGLPGREEWLKRTRWHVLSRIAMAVNRGLSTAKIGADIRAFFDGLDFDSWHGKSVFVRHMNDDAGYRISVTGRYNERTLQVKFAERGLFLERSETDDSTYGMFSLDGGPKGREWLATLHDASIFYESNFNIQ